MCMLCVAQIEIAQRKNYIQWLWEKAENATRDQRTNAFSSHSKTSKGAQARSRKHIGATKLEKSRCKKKLNRFQAFWGGHKKSDNLQYKMLVCWYKWFVYLASDAPSIIFFSWFLAKLYEKWFQCIFYKFTKIKTKSFECPKSTVNYEKTRLKCKSSAHVRIVLKKDWIVKKSFQKLKNVEKNI